MRNATIRRKYARAERLWVRFMTQPPRLIVPDYRAVNRDALRENREWVIPPAQVRQLAGVAAKGMVTKPPLMRNPQSNML